jgi:anti-sigma regulatory factor (Ser/Thr protein kinase)
MSRRLVWLQLLIGWLPVWVLFTTLILAAHANTSVHVALLAALRIMVTAALLGLVVQRFTERVPWPTRVRPSFVGVHLIAAFVYAGAWVLLNSIIESVVHRALVFNMGPGVTAYLMLGVWLYVMIAGVSYTTVATGRAARAEANAAKAQLSALRSQLNPHFLFNALHAVVQLIPREPKRAAQAAEQLAGLLRATIEEDRDLVPMADEWAFVEKYLELERLRFGDRLRVSAEITDEARGALIPLFALQTLVENAVRHGAAPRVEATDIAIRASTENGTLTVSVRDTGDGTTAARGDSTGTGLTRLRERLAVLYGADARLDVGRESTGGFLAELTIPRGESDG